MNALPAYSPDIAPREMHRRRTSQRSGPGYRIECPVCGHGSFQDESVGMRRTTQTVKQSIDGVLCEDELKLFVPFAGLIAQPVAYGRSQVSDLSLVHPSASRYGCITLATRSILA